MPQEDSELSSRGQEETVPSLQAPLSLGSVCWFFLQEKSPQFPAGHQE